MWRSMDPYSKNKSILIPSQYVRRKKTPIHDHKRKKPHLELDLALLPPITLLASRTRRRS